MNAPRIGGMLVGYGLVCRRKTWLSMQGLSMEQESEAVALGRLVDEASYPRRHRPDLVEATAPDGTPLAARIDGVDLRGGVLHETKKGRACEDAHLWQVRFYLWVLRLAGVTAPGGKPLRGQIDYPALRRAVPVTLDPEHETHLAALVADLAALAGQDAPPPRHPRRAFCRSCAFEELCHG